MGKYNERTVDEICNYIEEGMPQKDGAILSGIDETTFYRWIKRHASFASRVEASLLKYKEKLIKIVNVNSIKDGKLALEVLARRYSEDFGAKHTVEVINPQLELDRIKKLIDEKHESEKHEKPIKGEEIDEQKRLVSGHNAGPLQKQGE